MNERKDEEMNERMAVSTWKTFSLCPVGKVMTSFLFSQSQIFIIRSSEPDEILVPVPNTTQTPEIVKDAPSY